MIHRISLSRKPTGPSHGWWMEMVHEEQLTIKEQCVMVWVIPAEVAIAGPVWHLIATTAISRAVTGRIHLPDIDLSVIEFL